MGSYAFFENCYNYTEGRYFGLAYQIPTDWSVYDENLVTTWFYWVFDFKINIASY